MTSSPDAGAFARLRAAGFVCTAAQLSDYDLPWIGHTIGVGEDDIQAVMEVEASGGFDRLRRPKMLFEPHVLWRNLSGAARTHAASPTWAGSPVPTRPTAIRAWCRRSRSTRRPC
ncbi:N-acetylmuramidase domain-containing protein [Methylorubrum extorquens]|uniref:N-acetylmuramidase domain-containing protein n=1 Tax=Methylorubrum extorquens TaxID=408 RepID=UPI00288A92B2|nr:N-acetylmuramidase domain-containing protein [Methylorubrum extorquens]